MKYAPSIYARAFLDAKPDLKKFLSVVAKNGDFPRIDKIVAAIEEQETHGHGGKVVNVEFAREMDDATIKKVTKKFKDRDLVSVKIAPSLIAGMRITIDGEQELDGSFQRKINKLWHTKS